MEQTKVKLENMTDQQIKDKIAYYRKMATSCFKHADELDEYKNRRKGKRNLM